MAKERIGIDGLASMIAEDMGDTKIKAMAFINSFKKVVTDTLKSDGELSLVNFLTFGTRELPEREGHNPATRAKIKIAKRKKVVVKVGKQLKESIQD
jgi:DNA-binding protein HU-beta